MARYTGPSRKKSRTVGFSTLENGKDLARRPYKPGQHGASRRGKVSEYGAQLTEKQKVKFMYGLNERQFKKTFNEAGKMAGIHGENFLKLLESRLDNLVYRMGFANTRRGARQLVNHGHIAVDGKKVDIPSFRVKVGSTISLKDNTKELKSVNEALANVTKRVEYIDFDKTTNSAKYVRLPERNELNADIHEAMIVEFYNR